MNFFSRVTGLDCRKMMPIVSFSTWRILRLTLLFEDHQSEKCYVDINLCLSLHHLMIRILDLLSSVAGRVGPTPTLPDCISYVDLRSVVFVVHSHQGHIYRIMWLWFHDLGEQGDRKHICIQHMEYYLTCLVIEQSVQRDHRSRLLLIEIEHYSVSHEGMMWQSTTVMVMFIESTEI